MTGDILPGRRSLVAEPPRSAFPSLPSVPDASRRLADELLHSAGGIYSITLTFIIYICPEAFSPRGSQMQAASARCVLLHGNRATSGVERIKQLRHSTRPQLQSCEKCLESFSIHTQKARLRGLKFTSFSPFPPDTQHMKELGQQAFEPLAPRRLRATSEPYNTTLII